MKKLNVIDIGTCSYGKAWDIQRDLHTKRVGSDVPDTLILVEHPHVYTLGKNANAQHLIVSEEYLKLKGIEVYNIDRGGDITYHGPGQLVGYPIFNLKDHYKSISLFVHSIEEVLIRTLLQFGVKSHRHDGYTGVWVGNKKIAAIGMRVSRWVTMHGFALNVTPDLTFFSGIIPCGISDKGVTRIVDINPCVKWKDIKSLVVEKFVEVFGFENRQLTLMNSNRLIKKHK